MKGDGVGWLASKRLRKLMTDESLRNIVANRLYSAPSADRNTDAVDDVVSMVIIMYYSSCTLNNASKTSN